MAYAALASLCGTMIDLRQERYSQVHPCPEMEIASRDLLWLVKFIQGRADLDNSKSQIVIALHEQIREAARGLEDAIENHLSDRFLSQSESLWDRSLLVDLRDIKQEIDSFIEKVKKIKEECYTIDLRLSQLIPEDEEVVSERNDSGQKKPEIVRLQDEESKLKKQLMWTSTPSRLVVTIVGMVGIGKTALAKQVYEDPEVVDYFECRLWVNVGQKSRLRDILLGLVAQTNPEIDTSQSRSISELAEYVNSRLKNKRYLVVLDDVWDGKILGELKDILRDEESDSRILVTTRLVLLARDLESRQMMRFLDKDESWRLFLDVFVGDLIPLEFEEVAHRILNNCEGLPLAIIEIGNHLSKVEKAIFETGDQLLEVEKSIIETGNHLSKVEKKLEYWNKVADRKVHVFNGKNLLKVLYTSYDYLPAHLKECFIYMGAFPPGEKIRPPKLMNLWYAEGIFIHRTGEDILEAIKCLEDLVFNSVVLLRQRSSVRGIKRCGIHYIFEYLLANQAQKDKILHILNLYPESLEGIESHHRLSIHNNALFGLKDVYNSIASISVLRSLLCLGPHHQYPVPLCCDLRLLRVLDAVTIRFYKFPFQVLKLYRLTYLAITFNRELPASISRLWNLHYLIVRRDISIISNGAPSYLPVAIWEMTELSHLQVMGASLPNPPPAAHLPKLETLLDTGAHSCTEEILRRIPNLKKLRICIEQGLDTAQGLDWIGLEHFLTNVHEQKSLKCVVVNPNRMSWIAPTPPSISKFSKLRKLTLSGLGYPWEFMDTIAALESLEVLKLRCYAFQGPVWDAYKEFPRLRFLKIEDTDLEYWATESYCFPQLLYLIITNCYKLKEIPSDNIDSLNAIYLFDCSPEAVYSTRKKLAERPHGIFFAYSSWDKRIITD